MNRNQKKPDRLNNLTWCSSAKNMCAMIILSGGIVLSSPVQANDKYWVDPATGYAMGGYDMVSYWSPSGPVLGRGEYEVQIKNVTWRFSNKGNYEEFIKNVDTYAPQYSGYGAYEVSQGRTPRGNPTIWSIVDNKLYFFFSLSAKSTWEKGRKKFIREANKRWPALMRQIAHSN